MFRNRSNGPFPPCIRKSVSQVTPQFVIAFMTITLTSIRLRKRYYFFKLSWYGFKISMQAKKTEGFIKMDNTGTGYLHYTRSAWLNETSMKTFARTGAHLHAMKQSAELADELCTYSYEADALPDWPAVKILLAEKGKCLKFAKSK